MACVQRWIKCIWIDLCLMDFSLPLLAGHQVFHVSIIQPCCNLWRVTSSFNQARQFSIFTVAHFKKYGIFIWCFCKEKKKFPADLDHTVISLFFARLQGFFHFDASHGFNSSKCGFVRSIHVSQKEKDRRGGIV